MCRGNRFSSVVSVAFALKQSNYAVIYPDNKEHRAEEEDSRGARYSRVRIGLCLYFCSKHHRPISGQHMQARNQQNPWTSTTKGVSYYGYNNILLGACLVQLISASSNHPI